MKYAQEVTENPVTVGLRRLGEAREAGLPRRYDAVVAGRAVVEAVGVEAKPFSAVVRITADLLVGLERVTQDTASVKL